MFIRRFLVVGRILLVCFALLFPGTAIRSRAANQYSTMERISAGGEGIGGGSNASVSADGRYVVFESAASDLVPGTIEDSRDVFLRDRQAAIFERASVSTNEQTAYNSGEYSSPPVISGNGRYVAFMSMASDLVSNDTNGMPDIFVRDRQNGSTELISRSSSGRLGNSGSFTPAISATGRFVVYQSFSSNLVSNDENRVVDIFLRDRAAGTTELISVTTEGLQGEDYNEYGYSNVAVSDNGRFVVFSYQSLPIPGHPDEAFSYVYLRDRQEKTTRLIAAGTYPNLSSDGRYLVFVTNEPLVTEDQNISDDVYLFDTQTSQFERVSVAQGGGEAVDQYIFNAPDVSADGRYVVFQSNYDGLTEGDTNGMTDVFLRDRALHKTILVSGGINGTSGSGESFQPTISDEGTLVTFTSGADDLVPNDDNERYDVFAMNLVELGVLPGQLVFPRMYLPQIHSHSSASNQ